MTLAEFKAKRAKLLAEMQNIVDTRSENMDEATLNTVKTLKQEMAQIDGSIEAIETLRSEITKADGGKVIADSAGEYRASFGKYMRGQIDERELKEARSIFSGVAGAAAEAVPDDYLKELFEKISQYGVISPDCRHITTANNGELMIPKIDDTGNNTANWVAEGGDITKVDFSTSSMTMNAYKIATGIQMSAEFMEDAFFDVEGYVSTAFADRLARALELSYVDGVGGTQPLGISNDAATVSTTAVIGVPITIAEAIAISQSIPPASRPGSKFYVSNGTMSGWLQEVDGNGRPLLQPAWTANPADEMSYTIAGYPLQVNYSLNDTDDGATQLIFGNMKNYMIRDVRSLTIKRDEFTDMGSDMVNFYATMRVDAKVVSNNVVFAAVKNVTV